MERARGGERERRVRDKNFAKLPLLTHCNTAICSVCPRLHCSVLSPSKFRSCTAHSALRVHHQDQMQHQVARARPKTMFLWGETSRPALICRQHHIKSNQGQSQQWPNYCVEKVGERKRFAFYAERQTNKLELLTFSLCLSRWWPPTPPPPPPPPPIHPSHSFMWRPFH